MSETAIAWEPEQRRRQLLREYELISAFNRSRFIEGRTSLSKALLLLAQRSFLSFYSYSVPRWRVRLRQLGGKRAKPDFAIVAPIGCGLIDIATDMLLHPNVLAPLLLEHRTVRPTAWPALWPTERCQQRWAQRFGSALVPFFTNALHSQEILYNLAKLRPGVRVILVLREPAIRVYAHWRLELLLTPKRMAALPFAATFGGYVDGALDAFPDTPPFRAVDLQCSALEGSIYWKCVSTCFDLFGAENVLVVDAADYFKDRGGMLMRLQEFIGAPRMAVRTSTSFVGDSMIFVPARDRESIARLRTFFAPYNERLWGVLGKRAFAW